MVVVWVLIFSYRVVIYYLRRWLYFLSWVSYAMIFYVCYGEVLMAEREDEFNYLLLLLFALLLPCCRWLLPFAYDLNMFNWFYKSITLLLSKLLSFFFYNSIFSYFISLNRFALTFFSFYNYYNFNKSPLIFPSLLLLTFKFLAFNNYLFYNSWKDFMFSKVFLSDSFY